MDFSQLTTGADRLCLQGAKAILCAEGQLGLSPMGRATLQAIQRHVLHSDVPLAALTPQSPTADELVATLEGGPEVGLEGIATLWCLMPLVDGQLRHEQLLVLSKLLVALGRHRELADDLLALADGRRWAPKLRIFARVFAGFFHVGMLRGIGQIFAAQLGLCDRSVGLRYDQLVELPRQSFGHQLWLFYRQNNVKMPGRRGAYPFAQIGPHDAHHVLAGCDTSYEGEFLVGPFEAGASKLDSTDFLVTLLLQGQVGIQLDPSVPATTGLFEPDSFFRELARGMRVREDLLAADWDFWHYIELPLHEVRTRLGIEPGGNVSFDHPQWNGKDTAENQVRLL